MTTPATATSFSVLAHAHGAGLCLRERVAMPANNLMLVFDREGAAR